MGVRATNNHSYLPMLSFKPSTRPYVLLFVVNRAL